MQIDWDPAFSYFFVISGFVITASIDRALLYGDGISGFLLRRAAKLVPLYIVFIHLHIGFFILWSKAGTDPIFFRNSVTSGNLYWDNYLIHITFLQGLSPIYINTLLDGGWSIVCEVYFYLLAPLVLHRFSQTVTGAVWTLGVGLALSIGFSMLFGRHLGTFSYYAFPVQLPCFLMGVVCYRVREHSSITTSTQTQIAAASVMALLFFGFTRLEAAPLGGHVAISLLFSAALIVLRVTNGRGLSGVVQWIGRQSYALFLTHILILKIAYSAVFANGFVTDFWTSLMANLGFSLIGSLFLSWTLFDRVDRYFVLAMARLLHRRRALARQRGAFGSLPPK